MLVLQYWRSVDELIVFASDSRAPHAAAWREFNRRVGADASVGIWHETYTTHLPVGPGRGNARARLRRRQETVPKTWVHK